MLLLAALDVLVLAIDIASWVDTLDILGTYPMEQMRE